jgi:hypothetical protein
MVDEVLFVAVGARAEAEATSEKIGLGVTYRTIEICCIETGCAVRMAWEALRAHLDEPSSTSTDWCYSYKIALCCAFLAIICSCKARTTFPITRSASIIESIESASSKAGRIS